MPRAVAAWLERLLILGLLVAVLPFVSPAFAHGGDIDADEPELPPTVALVTFGPGPVYWERFGHNALLVSEPGEDPLLYNYGVFDFQQKNFFLNFARGRMRYRLAVQRFSGAVWQYQAEQRWLRVQQLNLEPAQARKLAEFLRWNAQPENAEYHYDYFLSNCSTRVRDAIDMAVGGQLRPQLQAQRAGTSYRFEATRLIAPVLPLALGMDLVMGAAGDPPIDRWQQSFVPMVLMDAVRQAQIRGADGSTRPLLQRELPVLSATRWSEPATPLRPLCLFLLLSLGFVALLLVLQTRSAGPLRRTTAAALMTLAQLKLALIGLVLLALWTLTDHWVMWVNHNLLLFNPLTLLLLPASWRSRRSDWQAARWQWRLALLIAIGGAALLPWLLLPGAQHNPAWIAAVLPVQLLLAWQLWRRRRL